MLQRFINKTFKPASEVIIANANAIISEYADQGYSLTLRQLYYQMVARALIENTQRSYKRIGSIINDARLAGLIDWLAIEDRTRNLVTVARWQSPAYAMRAVVDQYHTDLWANQPVRVEVWIEKEALVGVIADICKKFDVPYFACRGYVSQSEQWRAYMRSIYSDQELVILHFGDHDPSGIDMTRDNYDRLSDVFGGNVSVYRLALNMDQVEEYNPPPNPAKMTDSRFQNYMLEHGDQSWELDALEPQVINQLIEGGIDEWRDPNLWSEAWHDQEVGRLTLRQAMETME